MAIFIFGSILTGFLAMLVDGGEIGRTPKPGDIYVHELADPFEDAPKCAVLDVKKGWVKYQPQNNTVRTSSIREFRRSWGFTGDRALEKQ